MAGGSPRRIGLTCENGTALIVIRMLQVIGKEWLKFVSGSRSMRSVLNRVSDHSGPIGLILLIIGSAEMATRTKTTRSSNSNGSAANRLSDVVASTTTTKTPRTTKRAAASGAATSTTRRKATKRAAGSVVPSHDEIAQRAYEIYQRRGETAGDPVNDWLQAEAELNQERGLPAS